MTLNNREPQKLKVAVYLPDGENCCPKTGGALATWTRKVYELIGPKLDTHVFSTGFGTAEYTFHCHRSTSSKISNRLSAILRNRRLLGLLDRPKQFLSSTYARGVASCISNLSPDVIHVHNDPIAVVPLRRAAPNAHIILHMNNDHLVEGPSAGAVAESAVEASDEIAFCSEYTLQTARQSVLALQSKHAFVVHNGGQLADRSALRDRTTFARQEAPTLLFVGRIVPQKGLHTLLEAMPTVLEAFPKARLRVVGGINFGSRGTNSYMDEIKAHAAALNKSVELLGPMSHDDVQKEFLGSDVFVCPSQWNDPFPLVNLEAMGSGTPLIAFARGGIPEAVAEAGVLLQNFDSISLASAIVELLRDHARRQELAQLGYYRVQHHFTWNKIAEDWLAHLRGCQA
jgi:spore coat protein SA